MLRIKVHNGRREPWSLLQDGELERSVIGAPVSLDVWDFEGDGASAWNSRKPIESDVVVARVKILVSLIRAGLPSHVVASHVRIGRNVDTIHETGVVRGYSICCEIPPVSR